MAADRWDRLFQLTLILFMITTGFCLVAITLRGLDVV